MHPRTIFHGCQIVHLDPLNVKRSRPQNKLEEAMRKCMVSMAMPYMILENGSRPTNSIIPRVLLIPEH